MALVIFTVTLQLPLAGIVAPLNATEPPPAAAVTVPPAQVVAPLGVPVLTRFAGYVSVKAAPVILAVLGFVRVTVNTEVRFLPITFCVNDFATVGGLMTVRVADAGAPVPAFVVVTLPVLLL